MGSARKREAVAHLQRAVAGLSQLGTLKVKNPLQTRGSQVKGLHYIGSVDRSACWVVILGRGCSGNTNRNRSISNRCSADGSV